MLAALSLVAIAVFAGAAATDLRLRRIPNRLSLALAGLGAIRIALALAAGAGAAALADVGVALAVFGVAAMVFHFGLMGGGDVKLLAAGTLWLGAGSFVSYLALTALSGGALALLFLLRWRLSRRGTEPGVRTPLPYGVAIAAGGIATTIAALHGV